MPESVTETITAVVEWEAEARNYRRFTRGSMSSTG